ncbi:hypothetical protein IBX82_02335 [Neisseria gonorrhoeae]|nr:hypothetical protein IBX82_02335 [Neisseria gonorrhoeae]
MPSENWFSDGIFYGYIEVDYDINNQDKPDEPTPNNTVNNIEKRQAAMVLNTLGISSCGLSDTKYGAMPEITIHPVASSITVWARKLNVRLRTAKKPINRMEQITACIRENGWNVGVDKKSFISAHSKDKWKTGLTACRR